jgi:hypothetical protein
MGSIHSAASLVVRLCLPRARKRPVRSGGRTASRIVAVLAIAVIIGGATAAQAAASSGPSVIVNGDTTDIAVMGPDNSLKFYSAVDGSSTWNSETVASSYTTYSVPSMIVNGNTIYITARGPDDSLDCYAAATADTSAWYPATIAGPGSTFSTPSMILNGSDVNVAIEGPTTAWCITHPPSASTSGPWWISPAQARPSLRRR